MTYFQIASIIIGVVAVALFLFVFAPYLTEQQTPLCNNLSERIRSDVPIYSTEDGTVVTGSFFLGSGRIDTHPAYFFYTGDDTNGFQRQMLNTETVNVKLFRDSDTPYMIKKIKYVMKQQYPAGAVCAPIDIVELHVPKDTLIKEV